MNKKLLITLLAVSAIIFALSAVSATNLEDMNFNISSEFKPVEDAQGLQFTDESNDIRIRIFDDKIGEWEDGFSKYNETVYIYNETMGGETNEIGDSGLTTETPSVVMFNYAEYIKIDGKTYWVEIGSDSVGEEPNYEKILEDLDYFNEHNNFEPVPI